MNQLSEIELVTGIWNTMKYFIHDRADKSEAATQLVEFLFDSGLSRDDIEAIADDDNVLRAAFAEYCEIEDSDIDPGEWDDSVDDDDFDDDDEWNS